MNARATLDDPNLSVSELLRIDEACDRFEADWRDGREPNLAAYLSEAPEEVRAPLFRNLLSLELEYRRRAGRAARAALVSRAVSRSRRGRRRRLPGQRHATAPGRRCQ